MYNITNSIKLFIKKEKSRPYQAALWLLAGAEGLSATLLRNACSFSLIRLSLTGALPLAFRFGVEPSCRFRTFAFCSITKEPPLSGGSLVIGRGRRIRTLDTRFWRPMLYQLSYTPISIINAAFTLIHNSA